MTRPDVVRLEHSWHLHDDVVVMRRDTGEVSVTVSWWLRPVQRLVVLRMVADLLEAQPATVLVMHMHTGQVLARTATLAGQRLGELMDRPEVSTDEYLEAVELLCG